MHTQIPYADCSFKMAEHGGLNCVSRGKAGVETFVSVMPLIDDQMFLYNF